MFIAITTEGFNRKLFEQRSLLASSQEKETGQPKVSVPSITLGDELIILITGNDYAGPHAQFLQETEQLKVSVPSITLEKELIILTTGNDYILYWLLLYSAILCSWAD